MLEPEGLSRTDGKRPDGLTYVPRPESRSLIWDAPCASSSAASHLRLNSAGSAAGNEAMFKHANIQNLEPTLTFVSFAT